MTSKEIKEIFDIDRQILHIWRNPDKYPEYQTAHLRNKIYNILHILKKNKVLEILNRDEVLRNKQEVFNMFGFDEKSNTLSFEKFVSKHPNRYKLLDLLQKINDKELETVAYFSV